MPGCHSARAQATPQQIDVEHVDVVLNRLLFEATKADDTRVVD